MAYELSNQDAEAVATYTRVVDEFPTSLYRFDAESKIDSLSGGG
jgi:outer membrane protein assembly factor BamD (BamD/ComL family)